MKLKLLLIAVLMLLCLEAVICEALAGNVTLIIKHRMMIDGFEYPFSLRGIRMYLNDIENEQEDLFAELDLEARKLESREKAALGWGIGLGLGGGTAVVAGTIMALLSIFDNISKINAGVYTMPDLTMSLIGIALVAGGSLSCVSALVTVIALVPKENDFYDFVNKHNRLDRNHRIEVGLNERADGLRITLVYKLLTS